MLALSSLHGKRVLLIIAGGIAAYKSLDVIRRLKSAGATVRCILTRGGSRFITPLAVAALSGETVHQDLWSLTEESEMGHIRLAQETDLVLVAPATAHLLARMAHGLADDLASTALLATDRPILLAPAMNSRMWRHPATQHNLSLLETRGAHRIGPESGDLACGENGPGRMAEPEAIVAAAARLLAASQPQAPRPLAGRRALVTSGPTREPIDPVRYISNHSSGRQGHAIAAALAQAGAETVLVSGPVQELDPPGVTVIRVESAHAMLAACAAALPVEVAVFAAAVADWRVRGDPSQKIKKVAGAPPPVLALEENPDILATLAASGPQRPALVIGFAAETGDVLARATDKRRRKNCDWIVANDVSPGSTTFGGTDNTVHLIDAAGAESWPQLSKTVVAERLVARIAAALSRQPLAGDLP